MPSRCLPYLALAAVLAAGPIACRQGPPPETAGVAPTPVDPAATGTIAGSVVWQGPAPPAPAAIDMSGAPGCREEGAHDQSLVVNANGTLRWAFVYVQSGLEHWRFAVPQAPVELDQKGCMFSPHVFGIMTGQTLRVVSSDGTIHNVHAEAELNRPWNESMTPGMAPIEERFRRPEVMVPIRCNVHAWMAAYAGVVANPFYAVTGDDGAFTLRGVPAGSYRLAVWQEREGEREQTVMVLPGQTTRAVFRYGP